MARALVLWLIATVLGAVLVVLLPETLFGGGPLFELSARHGPSVADGVGIAVMLAGWLVYLGALWSRRGSLRPRWAVLALIVTAFAATTAGIAAFAADHDVMAYVLVLIAFAAQAALTLTAPR